MSMNYAFGISLFLLLFVALNLYFFYILNRPTGKSTQFKVKNIFHRDTDPNIITDIYEYLHYLPPQYKTKNSKFLTIQRNVINSFNSSLKNEDFNYVWRNTDLWTDTTYLYPNKNGAPGQILQAMRQSKIALADNALKGTQLKLLLLLEGKQKLYFKPKRYTLDHVIGGTIYAGFDRHNSEVFGYYLAVVLNMTWVAPATIRRINIEKEILPVSTLGLKKTMIRSNGAMCIYGKCYYCRANETVCAVTGELEGAAILYLDKPFRIYKHPWRRSYSHKKMEWEKDINYCKKNLLSIGLSRLLNLIDVAIFDFLIQNGDRHRYEVYKNKIVLLDNGKGLGNPTVDELDILAPLYQCCILSLSTWHHLELLSGGSLTETINILASFQGEKIVTEDHLRAVERRLLKVYATIQLCIGKYGSAKVFKTDFY